MHNGVAERIRLWGIDCPESNQAFGNQEARPIFVMFLDHRLC